MGRYRRTKALTWVAGALALLGPVTGLQAQGNWGSVGKQADYVVKGFRFKSGEELPELKLHYTTLGQPRKDAQGATKRTA